jgi:hypothetical protein
MNDSEFEELPEIEPSWLRLQRATTLRKRLLAAGYMPLPCNGKAPPIPGWQDIVATSKLIDTWERRYPDATNTGVLTDISPAIDIDIMRPDAAAAVEALAREHFEEHGYVLVRFGKAPKRAILLRTNEPFAKIARMFTAPDGSTQKIEILATGQQIVVAGMHPDTRRDYSWHGGAPGEIKREELPYVREADMRAFVDAAVALLINEFGFTSKDDSRRHKANGGEQPHANGNAGLREKAYAEAALEGCAAELAAAASGSRNELLNKLAFRLGRMAARGWISRATVEAVLTKAMTANGYVGEDGIGAVKATLRSGLDAGEKEPHPDLADQAEKEEWTEASDNTKTKPPASIGEWDAGDDVEPPPPRGWLLGNTFCRRFMSSLIADGGVGKTALRYAQLLSLATGRSLTGEYVFQRARVLIVSLEDDDRELRRRVLAAMLHHRIERAQLKGWLFLAAPGAAVGKLMTVEKNRLVRGPLADTLEAAIVGHNIDLVSLDPFVKTHSVEENDNSAIDDVVQILTDLGAKYDIAVDAPHHTSKGTAEPGNAGRGRGASAMNDAGRLVYTLATMSPEEAKVFGIVEDLRRTYIRMDSGKVNITPPLGAAKWFRLVGVQLGNATELYPSGDNVQTVEPWTPPDAWTVSAVTLNAVLTDIEAGMPNGQRYSNAPNAGARAAWPVVQKHVPSHNEAQCRIIIHAWIENGVLYPEEYDDPVDRKKRKGLRLDPAKRPS